MPLMLNAATPVGAVSNVTTLSGSNVPDNLSSFSLSECIGFIMCDFPTPQGPTKGAFTRHF